MAYFLFLLKSKVKHFFFFNHFVNAWVILLQPNAETDDDITPLLSSVAAGSLASLQLLIEVLSFL